ncbi:RHS repeat protein [Melghirimyces algeriensis]|uniref:RHS repeat-associated core domain-containing protein n=1 Tax=Melghirimyces algeriensis TaxID=910412 RepID=A0A521C1R6_9BACL|nr:RHS repeat-associated core domain-containing protein [Melghirimyces algeriensis]SMO52761.1 RHS repeat-associated core domain-containing protein [Melghirimyces algeriensis]
MVKPNTDGTEEDSYYGYNPHTDVEVLTDENGDTRATYGYTAYGKQDEDEFTGVDKPDPQTPDQEPYNVYRFNAKRWDAVTGEIDMGFRNYDPGLNRFTTRDMYNGALADMNLATDPWNMNRYAFAGGNPISGVEIDGHIPIEVKDGDISAEEYHQVTGHTIGGTEVPWEPDMSRVKDDSSSEGTSKETSSVYGGYCISCGRSGSSGYPASYRGIQAQDRGDLLTDSQRLFLEGVGFALAVLEPTPVGEVAFASIVGLSRFERLAARFSSGGAKGAKWKSVKKFGHTFSRHGAGKKNFNSLKGRAASSQKDQGQWLDNQKAVDFIDSLGEIKEVTKVEIPEGLGHVITPTGEVVSASHALIVPSRTGIKTAYPIR